MSTKDKYVYDPEHMAEISKKYKGCADSTKLIIDKLDTAKAGFLDNYKGQSDDTAPDLYAKLKEHMELLQQCFAQMETYVTYTKDTMVALDENQASQMKGEK